MLRIRSRDKQTLGVVVEVAMFVEYVGAVELYVLAVSATNHRPSVFDVIQETLGHEWIFVQVHQVRRLATKDRIADRSSICFGYCPLSDVSDCSIDYIVLYLVYIICIYIYIYIYIYICASR